MKKQNRKGFTIVELVIVIAVIATLSAVLIPTFGGIIKAANISSDKQMAASLTVALNADLDGIKDHDELYALIAETFDQETADDLAPKSAQHGYHFWYDVANKQIICKTVAEINDLIRARAASNNTVWKESDKHFRDYQGYFFLDKGGSEVANTLAKLDVVGSGDNKFTDVLATLSGVTGDDYDFAASALAKLQKTAVVAYGTFVATPSEVIDYVYFSRSITELYATDVVINNTAPLSLILPSNITKFNSYSLAFKTTSDLYVYATEEQLKDMFAANSVENCNIIVNDVPGYTLEGGELKAPNGDKVADLEISESSIVADMTLRATATKDNKIELEPQANGSYNLYVAVDYDGDITFGVLEFLDADGKKLSVRGEKWAATGNITYENGVFKATGFANDTNAFAGTITATIQGFTKTVNVYGVKPVNVEVDISNNGNLDIDSEANGEDPNKITDVTITLPYNPKADNTFNFTPSVVVNYPNSSVVLDGKPEVDAGAMSYAFDETTSKGALSLLANTFADNAVTTLTVSYSGVSSDVTYVVNLINNSDKSFAINEEYVTTQKYTSLSKYYVGNAGAFKLSYLFKATKDINGQTVVVDVYNGSTRIGGATYTTNGLDNALSLSDEAMNGSLNKDITIKIGVQGSAAKEEIPVHFIPATNVTKDTSVSDIPSGSGKDIVLLSEIDLSSAKTFRSVYGNLHKINVNTGSNKGSGYWAGFITLHGAMDNTVVVGPTYDEIKLNDNAKAWDGVLIVASTSTITNSYVYGFRAPVAINANNCTIKIENSTIEGGSYGNIHIAQYKELILNNVDLVQDSAGYAVGDKLTYGLGVLFDYSGCKGTVTLAGNTNLYNWINKTEGKKFTTKVYLTYTIKNLLEKMVDLGKDEGYLHNSDYVNTGFIQIEGDNKIEWIQQDNDERGSKAGNIRLLIKTYSAWSIPTCTDTCTHTSGTFLPEGWSHQSSNHSTDYLNGR